MIIIGVDPGANGGIAVLLGQQQPGCFKLKDQTEREIYQFLTQWTGRVDRAFLEKVHAMPKQGVSSTFKFGMSYGALRMALAAAAIPYETVAPGVWQRNLGCLSKGDKKVTRRAAIELFPAVKVTHAIADALLIAEYGRRLHTRNV